MKASNLFLILLFISINSSLCNLNLFRPFALTRQVKSNENQGDEAIKLVNKMSNESEIKSSSEQSIGNTIGRTISRIVDEIEIELENQLETHVAHSKNESELLNNEAQLKDDLNSPVRHHDHATTMSPISEFRVASEINLATEGSQDASITNVTTSDKSVNSQTPSPSTMNSTSERTLRYLSNDVSTRDLSQLRSAFRTFGSIFDFLTQAFDEFAEAIISRTATMIINVFFDRMSKTFFGI